MSCKTKKQMEAIRHTVTGVGWATPQQAALYIGVSHKGIRDLVATGEVLASRLGKSRIRIRYSDLDDYMISQRQTTVDLNGLVAKALKGITR